jgi:hypothetical protein
VSFHLGHNAACTTRTPPEMSFINRLAVFTHHLKSSQLAGKKVAMSIHHTPTRPPSLLPKST